MITIAPLFLESDAGAPSVADACLVRARVVIPNAGLRRGVWAWLLSAAMHTAALGGVYWYEAYLHSPAEAWAVQQGTASVALMVSAPATSRNDPETPLEVEPPIEPLQPQMPLVQRVSSTVTPLEVPPVEVMVIESKIVIEVRPPKQIRTTQPEQLIEPEQHVVDTPVKRSPPTEAVRQTSSKAEGLDQLDAVASIASEANDGADVDTLPSRLPSNPAPPYPADALRAGQEGRVMLRIVISPQGTAESVTVDVSSGVPSLDESAVTTVRRWRFSPARRRGVAIRSEVKMPVRFSIRGGVS